MLTKSLVKKRCGQKKRFLGGAAITAVTLLCVWLVSACQPAAASSHQGSLADRLIDAVSEIIPPVADGIGVAADGIADEFEGSGEALSNCWNGEGPQGEQLACQGLRNTWEAAGQKTGEAIRAAPDAGRRILKGWACWTRDQELYPTCD